jgi:glyoxylase-like metal-dependent hydrolase (beta-lactamase superfamily II)/ferredoxin
MPVLTIRFLSLVWGTMLLCRRDGMETIGRIGVDAFAPLDLQSIQPGFFSSTVNAIDQSKGSRDPRKSARPTASRFSRLQATKPSRYTDNAEGPLYVNNRCINCSACSMFAPTVFSRESASEKYHIVSKQPVSEREIEESRAALLACPVAAIKVEKSTAKEEGIPHEARFTINPKSNALPLPFPREVSPNLPGVYFVGHHNSKSFGAAPYLVFSPSPSPSSSEAPQWIMIDSPRYSAHAVKTVEFLTGPDGPSHLVLTHVDDTADHNRWKDKYPNLKRVFHAGDLGVHNWIGDNTLENVEILLESRSSDRELQHFDLNGIPIESAHSGNNDFVLVHTPGHSPGSIALLKNPTQAANGANPGVLFSGDTYSYTTREGGHMSGIPLYGNDRKLQSKILPLLLDLDWQVLAPGHGHVRDYTLLGERKGGADVRKEEMEAAIEELSRYF